MTRNTMKKITFLSIFLLLAFTTGTRAESLSIRLNEGDKLEEALQAQTNDLGSITSLTISGPLDRDEMNLFEEMTNLETLDLRGARFDTFTGCVYLTNLKTIWLPACLKEVEMPVYGCSSLTDVYCYSVLPYAQELLGAIYTPCTLHVPGVSVEAYQKKMEEEWADEYVTVVPLEEPVKDACIFRYFTLENLEGWQDMNVTLSYLQSWGDYMSTGTLIVNDPTDTWHIDNFRFPVNFWEYYEQYNDDWVPMGEFYNRMGTLLCQSPVEAEQVEAELVDDPYFREWTFFSLPFDVKMSDITSNADTRYVIRRYSGKNRASLQGATWENVGKDEMLNAYEGYILKRDRSTLPSVWEDDETTFYFRLPAADTENKQNIFRTGDVVVPVKPYPAEKSHNSGWNLLGNPYPCWFSINQIEESALLMQYDEDNLTYQVYSTKDDNFILRPYDAFFIQYSEDVPQLTFKAEGRIAEVRYGKPFYGKEEEEDEEYDDWDDDWDDYEDWESEYEEYQAPRFIRKSAAEDRMLYNIFLSNGEHKDRTRLVINPKASLDYELQRDANKMLTTETKTAQIYLCASDGMKRAIDERPTENGLFPIGILATEEGTLTFHIETEKKNESLWLTDHSTGICVNLSEEDYTFHTEAGTTEGRFCLSFKNQADAIQSISTEQENKDDLFYDLSGRPIQKGKERGIVVSKEKKTFFNHQ